MKLTVDEVISNYKNNRVDFNTLIIDLMTLIENSFDEAERIKSLSYMGKIGSLNENSFKFIENLFISDSNPQIRQISGKLIGTKFATRALRPLKWALEHETNHDCLISIIKTLSSIKSEDIFRIFVEILKNLRKRRYFDENNEYPTKHFEKSLKREFKDNFISRSTQDLANILINYFTIKEIIKKFYTIFFDWEFGLITHLDLSEIGWNVNIWRQKYAERLHFLTEIPGLTYLTSLRSIDLSNNKLNNLQGIQNLQALREIKLCNNHLNQKEDLAFLKKLKSLRYLDISGNEIIRYIDKKDFPNTYIVKYHGLNPRLESFKVFYTHH